MPAPRSTPAGRPVVVHVRLSEAEARLLDAERGRLTRSALLRYGLSLVAVESARTRAPIVLRNGKLVRTNP